MAVRISRQLLDRAWPYVKWYTGGAQKYLGSKIHFLGQLAGIYRYLPVKVQFPEKP
jgi:hypothetical protein